MNWKITFLIVITLCLLLIGYLWRLNDPLQITLRLSKNNRLQLEEVLTHYEKIDVNKQKLRAAKFLISNCYIHSNRQVRFEDHLGNPVRFFPPQYGSSSAVRKVRDSLSGIYQLNSKVYMDCQNLKGKYLIAHIDTMFNIWQSTPWFNQVNFNQFCRYILPYRAQSAPLSDWPSLLWDKYRHVTDTLSHKSILSASRAINSAMASDIKYERCWMGGLGQQSVPEMLESKSGMCDDLTVYGVCAMRACGIPATTDFTIWGKTNMGHSWGVVFDEQGKAWSFGPGEQNPGEHINIFTLARHRKLAKVYRQTFEIQDECLSRQVRDILMLPPFFRQMNIKDVTSEYTPTYDVTIPVNLPQKQSDYVYICVFNMGKWKPVHWAAQNSNMATFSNMGDDLLYIAGYYNGFEIVPLTQPFIFNEKQQLIYLDNAESGNQTIFFKKRLEGVGALKLNQRHSLYKWQNNNWKLIEEVCVDNDSSLVVKGLSEKVLYKFGDNSRPFIIKDREIAWW